MNTFYLPRATRFTDGCEYNIFMNVGSIHLFSHIKTKFVVDDDDAALGAFVIWDWLENIWCPLSHGCKSLMEQSVNLHSSQDSSFIPEALKTLQLDVRLFKIQLTRCFIVETCFNITFCDKLCPVMVRKQASNWTEFIEEYFVSHNFNWRRHAWIKELRLWFAFLKIVLRSQK